jgi:hypothetical protein
VRDYVESRWDFIVELLQGSEGKMCQEVQSYCTAKLRILRGPRLPEYEAVEPATEPK